MQLVLDEALESVSDDFDFVVVDVKGGLDLMGQMAMYASDLVVIPCDRDAETVDKAQLTYKYALGVAKKRERIGRSVPDAQTFAKYLLSKWNPRRKASTELEQGLSALPPHAIFSTRVFSCEDIQRARNEGLTIFEFAERLVPYKRSKALVRAVNQFERLSAEVIAHGTRVGAQATCANA